MKPHYRMKIIQSDEFQNVISQILGKGVGQFHVFTKEEKEQNLTFALQLLSYCLSVIARDMPKEFTRPIVKTAEPLNDLLKSIYEFSRNNNLKNIPKFRDIAFPIT